MEVVDGPRLEHRGSRPTLGIRIRTPFRGMLAERDRLLAELIDWMTDHGVQPVGARWAWRFEIYVTDPRTEPRKTRWETELAFLTR